MYLTDKNQKNPGRLEMPDVNCILYGRIIQVGLLLFGQYLPFSILIPKTEEPESGDGHVHIAAAGLDW
jgi:hypothetical protein